MNIFNEQEKFINLVESMNDELNEATIRFTPPEIRAVIDMVDGGWDGTKEPDEVEAIEKAIFKLKASRSRDGICLLTRREMQELYDMVTSLYDGADRKTEEYAESAMDKIEAKLESDSD